MNKKVIIITGASSGIGKETALLLKENNFIVYAGSRDIENNQELINKGINIKNLDVTNDYSVKDFVNYVLEKEKRIDILLNNAGYGLFGPIETVSLEEAKKQIDVNVYGIVRMCQNVISVMRKQNSGLIINISSALGRSSMPFSGWYNISKYAVEALNDDLRMELKRFGIKVVKINPGMIKTPWYSIMSDKLLQTTKNTVYSNDAMKMSKYINEELETNTAQSPFKIANLILKICNSKKPKSTYVIGKDAKLMIWSKKNLSSNLYDKIMIKMMLKNKD